MKMKQRVRELLAKAGSYKYAVLVFLLGIGLMIMPQGNQKQAEQKPEPQPDTDILEENLELILSRMYGVGEVEVLLTLEKGMSFQYQTDEQIHTQQEESEVQKETVLVEDDTGRELPITVKTTYPTYQGALVVCQGADSAAVRLDIVNAVSDLTGLRSDKISVIKMKDH